jgi:aminopeptidase-like protein
MNMAESGNTPGAIARALNAKGLTTGRGYAVDLPQRRARSGLTRLERNRERLYVIRHGLTVWNRRRRAHDLKRGRRGDADVDRAAEIVLWDSGGPHQVPRFRAVR